MNDKLALTTVFIARRAAFFYPPSEKSGLGHVCDILTERYGGVEIQRFNRDPLRTKAEVIAVAVEAELRSGIRSPEP